MSVARKQLELAAKAAGLDDASWNAEQTHLMTAKLPGLRCFWNPQYDHGQLLDLAMACKINILPRDRRIEYDVPGCPYVKTKIVDGQGFHALAHAVITAAAEQQLAKEKKE